MRETNKLPISEKYNLTITEAVEYFGIGERKLRKLVQDYPEANWLLMNGSKALIKRRLFEQFIDATGSI